MTPEQFTYWLQGYAEINGAPPSEQQWAVILDHLKLVFDKLTPERGEPIDKIEILPTGLPSDAGTPSPNLADLIEQARQRNQEIRDKYAQKLRAGCVAPAKGTVTC